MNLPAALFRQPLIIALGWALLHFLWQGALIALLVAALNRLLQRGSARLRYVADCLAMLIMLIAFISTFVWLSFPAASGLAKHPGVGELDSPISSVLRAVVASPVSTDHPYRWHQWLNNQLPWMVSAWLAGVVILSLRTLGGWISAHAMRRRARPARLSWQRIQHRAVSRLEMRRKVALFESTLLKVPAVIGWIRPVIVVPVSGFAGLTPQMIEAVLAHELAHIRRHDYFLNILQTAVETVLFYHPAVWWVGKKIREEREYCCDDAAVGVCGDAFAYARALTALEEFRCAQPRLLMAAAGGSLLARIHRLIGVRQTAASGSGAGLAGALALVTLGGICTAKLVSANKNDRNTIAYASAERIQATHPNPSGPPALQPATQASSAGTPHAPQSPQLTGTPHATSAVEMSAGEMFQRATKDGNLQTIETLLSLGLDPNAPLDGRGYTPLWYAIENGRPGVVDLLLAAHADPNKRGMPPPPFYASPLELALQLGNLLTLA